MKILPLCALPLLLLATACSTEPAADPHAPAAPEATPAARAEPRAALSAEGTEAYLILRDAERFTDGAIYDGGITPVEVRAWRWLMREPEAGAAFAQLLEEATLPGRLFALCGLFYTDPEAFTNAVEPYRSSTATVFFQTGCEGLPDMPVSELVEAPRAPALRLASRDETNRAWTERTGTRGGYHLDILGGGYPSDFRDGGGWHAVELEPLDEPAAR